MRSLNSSHFLPSPDVVEINNDAISSVMNNESNAFVIEQINKLSDQQGWFAPTLFGTQDKFFVHAMVTNPDNFVKRAYFKVNGVKQFSKYLRRA